jgi:UPF0755 protein
MARRSSRSLVLLLLLVGAGATWFDVQRVLFDPLPIAAPIALDIPNGATLTGTLDTLETRAGLPGRGALYLRLYARLAGESTSIKAGEYQIAPGQSAHGALLQFVSGKVLLHELRLVEGWTFGQAWQVVAASPDLAHTLNNPSADALMQAIGHAETGPEGRFLPETYRFPKGTTDVAFLRRAFEAMQTLLQREWSERDPALNLKTPDEALILASIVEKETGQPAERGLIAGVFTRRLQRGMRLQTDPTVIYGLGAAFDGNLRRVDLERDTPYNSYTREGLPPTPICLPGRAALHAAMHPESGDALFFVARGDGSHQFSATLEEHDAAVRKYQLGKP